MRPASWSPCGRVSIDAAVARTVGDLLPLFVAPMLYGEVPLLIGALGSSYHDVRVQSWELAIFGQHPSRVLATFMPNPAWSELLHMGYLAYYPAIFVPPLLLYVRGERRGYAQTVLALTVAYVACWVIFAVAPVEGPRYLWTPNAPDGPARRLTVAILAAGSSRGAAFPSSHMAVSVVQTVMAIPMAAESGRDPRCWYRCSSGSGRCTAGFTTGSTSLPGRFWVSWWEWRFCTQFAGRMTHCTAIRIAI